MHQESFSGQPGFKIKSPELGCAWHFGFKFGNTKPPNSSQVSSCPESLAAVKGDLTRGAGQEKHSHLPGIWSGRWNSSSTHKYQEWESCTESKRRCIIVLIVCIAVIITHCCNLSFAPFRGVFRECTLIKIKLF